MNKEFNLENFIIQFMRMRGYTVYDRKIGEVGCKISVPTFAKDLASSSLRNKLKSPKYSEVKHPIDADCKPNLKVNYCYQCGTKVRDQKYCHGCGRKLLWPKHPQQQV